MNSAEREINKLAVELYDKAAVSGSRFNPAELVDELYIDLVSRFAQERSATDDLIRIAADKAIRSVDRSRTKPVEQGSLADDLDRVLPVGESNRRARRHMDNVDWTNHIAHVTDNAARVNAAAAREQRRYAELSSFLAAGMDTEAALAAWQTEHVDEVLA